MCICERKLEDTDILVKSGKGFHHRRRLTIFRTAGRLIHNWNYRKELTLELQNPKLVHSPRFVWAFTIIKLVQPFSSSTLWIGKTSSLHQLCLARLRIDELPSQLPVCHFSFLLLRTVVSGTTRSRCKK